MADNLHKVAIIGFAGGFPGAECANELWDLTSSCSSAVKRTNQDQIAINLSSDIVNNTNFMPFGGGLNNFKNFDSSFFGYSPKEARYLDPQIRKALEYSWHAFEHAGYCPNSIETPAGVYLASSVNSYFLENLSEIFYKNADEDEKTQMLFLNESDFLSTRVAHFLNLKGPAFTLKSGCSSSSAAIHNACNGLYNFDCDLALAGGISIKPRYNYGYIYADGGIQSSDGSCIPFSDNASGTVFTNGIGIVVLKRLDDAIQDGDTIHGIIRSIFINNERSLKWLCFCFPHVVIDGIGIDNLMHQISTHYSGLGINKDNSLIYAAFCRESSREFWTQEIQQYQPITSWPSGNHLDKNSYKHIIKIDIERKKNLCKYASELNVSLPTLLFALFYISLYRTNFASSITIGCPAANRVSPLKQKLISNCINTIPITMQIDGKQTLKEFILSFKSKFLQCLSFQEVPIEKILSEIADKDLERNFDGIFDIIFSYLNVGQTFKINDATIQSEWIFPQHAKSGLVLSVIDKDNILELVLESQGSKFNIEYLRAFGDVFNSLLLRIQKSENYTINSVDIFTEEHKEVIRSNALYHNIKAEDDITKSFIKIALKYPQKIAIIDENTEITYEELLLEAKKVKYAIENKGIIPGSAIGISLSKTWRVISSILGVLLSGCYYIPLDPKNPKSRLRYIKEKANIEFVINEEVYTEIEHYDTRDVDIHSKESLLDKIAYIIFTSGTTGQPKGVAITHRNVVRLFSACQEWGQFSHKDNWSFFHSYAFDFSVWEMFGALFYGGTLIIIRNDISTNVQKFLQLITDHKISIISQTPTAFNNLLSISDSVFNLFAPRLVIFGGESLNPRLIHTWYDKYKNSKTKFVNMYGITETTVHSTFKFMDERIFNSNIGRPLKDVGMVIVGQNQELLPYGVPGEIWITGQGVCKEYLNDPQINEKKFIYKFFPFVDSKTYRFYKTGDLGVLHNSKDFEYLGRIDTQIKINGYRIEAQEVILAINEFTNILDSCVVDVELENKNISTLNEDNFFEQGGDSLSAIRIVNIINNDLKIKLSPVALFSYPKLNDFTRYALDHINNKTKCKEEFYDQL